MSSRKRSNAPPATARPTKVWLAAGAAVVVIALVGVGIADLGGDDAVSLTCTPVSGFADVHGLAVAPDNASLVYVATHHGLMRGTNDADWCRLGNNRDDFMGFSMHPDNGSVFWVSGHPRSGGNMGVLQSTNGGYSWDFLALEGVDFHAMTVSPEEPDRLWGLFRGEVYRSDDGGHGWDIVSDGPRGTRSLAAHPRDADVLYAATGAGIFRSPDAGVTWLRANEVAAAALAIHPMEPEIMVVAAPQGTVAITYDSGETWSPVDLQAPGIGHITFARGDPGILYAATYGGALFKSEDGALTWRAVL